LRYRLALAFAGVTSLTVAGAAGLAVGASRQAQERQLDHALFERARHEADETARLGALRLNIEQTPSGVGADIEPLVKYGAAFEPDGRLLDSTGTFRVRPPTFEMLGRRPGDPVPQAGFDFVYGGQTLRAVLVEMDARRLPGRPLLLLAAPRAEIEGDLRHLVQVMALAVAVSVLGSLFVGWWAGGRMTRGIEAVARVARRVSEGHLDARVGPSTIAADDEVRILARDLDRMIGQLGALIEAERRFVSSAAHELRSPLTALRGELELALRRPRSAEDYRAAIRTSLESTERLVLLAEDLLDLARASTRADAGERIEAKLLDVIDRAVGASLARAEARREVQVDVPDLVVPGRAPDLSRMVRNLVDNAVAHASAGSTVRVRAERRDEPGSRPEVLVSVENDGEPVPEAMRARIFEPFFRGDEDRERSGAGLGLAIAREIARAHGGDLGLDTNAECTRFVVRLPCA
jgi:two-component system heavy metal sensor histidine kinase CusS